MSFLLPPFNAFSVAVKVLFMFLAFIFEALGAGEAAPVARTHDLRAFFPYQSRGG